MNPWPADGEEPPKADGASVRGVTRPGYAAFILLGWMSLLGPSLIREIEREFDQSDAGIGLVYLLGSLAFVVGSLGVGVVVVRVGRGMVMPAAAALIGAGLLAEGTAPTWAIYVLGAVLAAVGSGAIEAALNALFLDLFQTGRGGGLNRLHLCFSIGALTAPMVVGWLVTAGVGWRLFLVAAAVAALAVAAPLGTTGRVPVRRPGPGTERGQGPGRTLPAAPMIALAVAIGCYVAAEMGVSSWLVRFLAAEPLSVATFALGLFWTGLALGRLLSIRLADRHDLVVYGSSGAFLGALALAVAVLGPGGWLTVALFGLTGLAFGPIYPVIMAVAGGFYPARASSVAGILTTAAVVGSIVYPPAVGLASATVGLGAGMVGAIGLSVCSGLAVVAAGRAARQG